MCLQNKNECEFFNKNCIGRNFVDSCFKESECLFNCVDCDLERTFDYDARGHYSIKAKCHVFARPFDLCRVCKKSIDYTDKCLMSIEDMRKEVKKWDDDQKQKKKMRKDVEKLKAKQMLEM